MKLIKKISDVELAAANIIAALNTLSAPADGPASPEQSEAQQQSAEKSKQDSAENTPPSSPNKDNQSPPEPKDDDSNDDLKEWARLLGETAAQEFPHLVGLLIGSESSKGKLVWTFAIAHTDGSGMALNIAVRQGCRPDIPFVMSRLTAQSNQQSIQP